MTTAIIITFCSLLLIAYLFEFSFSNIKIPSVILLLLLGWIVKQVTVFLGIHLPDFSAVLPILGTIGLILIVLEGSLELELNKSKLILINKSFLGALLPLFALAFLLAYLFQYFGNYSLKDCLTNAIPFCIISSAIAIPSVRGLKASCKEFIIFESSLSDIIGVLFFNFIVLNDSFGFASFGLFGLQLIIITIISIIATIGLSFLLNKIEHHVKFVPIILLAILIYEISHIYNLPALIFILLFGLSIGNFDKLKHFKWFEKFQLNELKKEVKRFKELTVEAAFLIRTLFFLLFGYLLETSDIFNIETITLAIGIVFIIFAFRIIQLKLSILPLPSLLFVAPRGLITILLFLSIDPAQRIFPVNKSLIIQVILLTSIVMMFGLMSAGKDEKLPPIKEVPK